jgi:uncharacterized protein
LRLAILSLSARIYAQMARSAGFEVLAVDAFADVDTQQAAQQVWRLPALAGELSVEHAHALFEQLDSWQPDALLIGSGFEASIDLYESLYQRYALAGNTPALLAQVKNPYWLSSYCAAHGVMTPPVQAQAPQQGQWLYKVAGQSGGSHVLNWDQAAQVSPVAQAYWQMLQPGLAVGALFVAEPGSIKEPGLVKDPGSVTLIGVHALRQRPGNYTYAGATRLHEPQLIAAMQALLAALVPDLGLVGINSLDAIWQDGQLHLLEINPRLSASMRLYTDLPLIQAQLASCQGGLMPMLATNSAINSATSSSYASHCILYARQAIETERVDFPDWLEDKPDGGSISAGLPVCSLYAEAATKDELQQVLQDKKTQLEKLWGTYVCERIEFNIH